MLILDQVSKTIAQKTILQPLSLHIEAGTLVGILGESGSGKTTLLKIIAGLEDPDTGLCTWQNQRIIPPSQQLIPGHKAIRMVFQDFQLMPKHTIYQNLAYELRFLPKSDLVPTINFWLQTLHLTHTAHQLPAQLSGGEQQRVALAKALATKPELLLLDEPLSHLDYSLKKKVKNILQNWINTCQITTIWVSHEPQELLPIAQKLAILRQGNLLEYHTPTQLYKQPRYFYTAQLLGELNLVPKTLLAELDYAYFKEYNYYIRPESLQWAENPLPNRVTLSAQVLQMAFYGAYWHIRIRLSNTLEWVLFSPNIPKNDMILVYFEAEKLLFFPND